MQIVNQLPTSWFNFQHHIDDEFIYKFTLADKVMLCKASNMQYIMYLKLKCYFIEADTMNGS